MTKFCLIKIAMTNIPNTLAPFFQEYDFPTLNPQRDLHTIIERVLQFGNRAEIRWLFDTYSEKEISNWVRRFAKDKLPQPHRAFWQTVLEIGE
jgi:hypothetical protein